MSSLLYLVVILCFFSFLMSAGRLLNCFIVVENLGFILVMLTLLTQGGVLYLSLIVIFTLEAALALIVLFRSWDTSALTDVVDG